MGDSDIRVFLNDFLKIDLSTTIILIVLTKSRENKREYNPRGSLESVEFNHLSPKRYLNSNANHEICFLFLFFFLTSRSFKRLI